MNHNSERGNPKVNKYTQRYLTSPATRDMQVKILKCSSKVTWFGKNYEVR